MNAIAKPEPAFLCVLDLYNALGVPAPFRVYRELSLRGICILVATERVRAATKSFVFFEPTGEQAAGDAAQEWGPGLSIPREFIAPDNH